VNLLSGCCLASRYSVLSSLRGIVESSGRLAPGFGGTLEQRLLDTNRTIGQPNNLTIIVGRNITRHNKGKLRTVIEDLTLPNPVIRSHYRKGFLKHYVRDRHLLRTEPATQQYLHRLPAFART